MEKTEPSLINFPAHAHRAGIISAASDASGLVRLLIHGPPRYSQLFGSTPQLRDYLDRGALTVLLCSKFHPLSGNWMRNGQLIRQWKILSSLSVRAGMTYEQILSALEPDDVVSLRTLQRDLTALEMAGFPLQSELRDKQVFWSLSLPHGLPFPIELDELIALYSAALAARVQKSPEARGLASVTGKLSSKLPEKTRKFLDAAQRALIFIGPGRLAADGKDGGLSDRITRCAVESKTIEMLYDSLNSGRRKWRRVDPYAIVVTPSASYLWGYCHQAKEPRVFHLGRIRELRESDHVFTRPDFSVEKSFQDSFEIYRGRAESVRIRFTGKSAVLASEKHWHASQRLKKVPEGVQLELFVHPGKDLQHWILGFGAEAEVLEPEPLRHQIAEAHSRAAESYALPRPQKKPPLSVTEPKSAKTGEAG